MTTDSLDDLAAQAAQLEGTAPAGEGQQAAPEPQHDNGQVLAGVFIMARDLFCYIAGLQSPRQVLHDAALAQLGAQWGAVADKRGWDLQRWMGDYRAEIVAASSTLTLGMALVKAVRTETTVLEAKAKEPAPAAEPATDGAPG